MISSMTHIWLRNSKLQMSNCCKNVEYKNVKSSSLQIRHHHSIKTEVPFGICLRKRFLLKEFGVRNGKGPCDACAGRVKTQLTNLVKTETCVINNAKSCFEAAKDNLESQWPVDAECKHYLLTFNFTPKLTRRPNTSKWGGVKDT